MPIFYQDAGCIHLSMEWTPLKHIGFYFILALNIVRKQKENMCL